MPTGGGWDVFVSVGGTATDAQEAFVRGIEDRLRIEGMTPHTVGRNEFGSGSPLKTVIDLMDQCCGTVIIALERQYYPAGVEKRGGPKATELSQVKLPTCWNQIEAALAYSRRHPLMVIVEDGVKSEGLLEPDYDWYVQRVPLKIEVLSSMEFNGILANWKEKVRSTKSAAGSGLTPEKTVVAAELTVGQLVGGMKAAQLWSLLAALAALLAGAFAVGARLGGK